MLIAGFRHVIKISGEFVLSVCQTPGRLRERVLAEGPDLVLVDVSCGIPLNELTRVRDCAPDTGLILWVDNVCTEFVCQAIAIGVLGILRKNSETDLCLKCLSQVGQGKSFIEDELSEMLVRTRTVALTPRERQLMEMLAQGMRNKEAAFRLGITENTVKTYLSRLYEKVGASDRFELALLALKNLNADQSRPSMTAAPTMSASISLLMPAVFKSDHGPVFAY